VRRFIQIDRAIHRSSPSYVGSRPTEPGANFPSAGCRQTPRPGRSPSTLLRSPGISFFTGEPSWIVYGTGLGPLHPIVTHTIAGRPLAIFGLEAGDNFFTESVISIKPWVSR